LELNPMAPKKAVSKPAAPAKKAAPKVAPKKASKAKKDVKGKKGAPSAPAAPAKPPVPLFDKRPKNWGIGQDLPPKKDLTRYVKWPLYIKRQRQKRVLFKRLRVPPAINQFSSPVDRHTKKELMKFALKYKPEGKLEKRTRLRKEAEAKLKDPKAPAAAKKAELKCGIQRVTRLIEQKRAKLVMIAHDVDPIELVIYLPALCKKMDVPYCIVKGKANLGRLVGFKTATCCAFMDIASSDKASFDKLLDAVKLSYNDRYEEIGRKWGGLAMGRKSKQRQAAKEKAAKK